MQRTNKPKTKRNMDEVFKDLEKAGRTDVENLIKWLKDSKVIDVAKEEKVRTLFKDTANEQKVELEKFQAIVAQIAVEQAKTSEQLVKQLVDTAPKLLDAAIAGLQAFKEALQDDCGRSNKNQQS